MKPNKSGMLALVLAGSLALSGCGGASSTPASSAAADAKYTAGTFTGEGQGYGGTVTVTNGTGYEDADRAFYISLYGAVWLNDDDDETLTYTDLESALAGASAADITEVMVCGLKMSWGDGSDIFNGRGAYLVESDIHILDVLDVGVQHGSGEIAGEQQVAAFAHVQQGPGQLVEVQALELRHALIFDETRAGHFHPERVHRREVVVELYPHSPFQVEARKSSSIWLWSILEGESIITSRPWLFFGKAM